MYGVENWIRRTHFFLPPRFLAVTLAFFFPELFFFPEMFFFFVVVFLGAFFFFSACALGIAERGANLAFGSAFFLAGGSISILTAEAAAKRLGTFFAAGEPPWIWDAACCCQPGWCAKCSSICFSGFDFLKIKFELEICRRNRCAKHIFSAFKRQI